MTTGSKGRTLPLIISLVRWQPARRARQLWHVFTGTVLTLTILFYGAPRLRHRRARYKLDY